jgi:hypothetical protein
MGSFKKMLIGLLPFMAAMEKNTFEPKHELKSLGYGDIGLQGIWHQSPIYSPKRKKLKGWQKENKRRKR